MVSNYPFVKPFGHKKNCPQIYKVVSISPSGHKIVFEHRCDCGKQYFMAKEV